VIEKILIHLDSKNVDEEPSPMQRWYGLLMQHQEELARLMTAVKAPAMVWMNLLSLRTCVWAGFGFPH